MRSSPATWLLPLILTHCAPAPHESGPVPLWGRWEASFRADEPAPEDAEFTVRLTAPSGSERSIDGFWNGGELWKARFLPPETGTWTYRTTCRPPIPGLEGQRGQFEVVASEAAPPRFSKHGAISVSSDRRHLAHADTTPFLWLADTAWSGALMSTDDGWDVYLADRVAKGFTAIQFVTTQWRAAYSNLEGEVAYTGFEEISINPRFFDRIDRRVDAVNDAGLLAAPVLLWTLGEPERNPGRLPESQAIRLARYLVARYQGHHVVWLLAGDENFSGETGERWRRIGRSVFGGRDHAPATIHPQGRQWHFDDFRDEQWLDLSLYQSSHGGGPITLQWLQSGPPSQKWTDAPVRPVLNSEPGYEDILARERGEVHTADDVRPQLWWSLLNTPTAGVTYGAHGIWSWQREAAVALNHDRFGVAKPWREALGLPGSGHVRHVADLFGSIEWWTLRPKPGLVAEQATRPEGHIAASASEDGRLAVVYLPKGGPASLRRELLAPDLGAIWFNPRTGERLPADLGSPIAPSDQDWALVVAAQ